MCWKWNSLILPSEPDLISNVACNIKNKYMWRLAYFFYFHKGKEFRLAVYMFYNLIVNTDVVVYMKFTVMTCIMGQCDLDWRVYGITYTLYIYMR